MPSKSIAPSGSPIVGPFGNGDENFRQAINTILTAVEDLKRAGDGSGVDGAVTVQDLEDLGYISVAGNTMTRVEGWDDITADLGSGKVAGANVPTWATFRDGINAYSFAAASMNEVWITFHIRHDYKDATDVYPHIHWSPNTTSTGVVRWGFEYTVAKGHDQQAFATTTTVYVETTISSDKQYQHMISEVSDEDAFNAFEPDSLVLMRIFRDGAHANDTFPDAVFGFTADLHFQGDGQFTPNKAAPFE